jgi:hypothetical protein
MLKIPVEYDRDTSPVKLTDISRQVSPASGTRCLCWYLPYKPGGLIRNKWNSGEDSQQIRNWSQCMGRVVRYYLVTVASNFKKLFVCLLG